MAKDYYNILGVEKNASKEEIKRAYKRLAKKCHPDLNKEEGSSEKFKELNEAASVLGDDNKRSQYDQFGTTADKFGNGRGGGFSGFDFSDFTNFSESFDFGDIFDSFFGGGSGFGSRRKHSGTKRGSDLRFDMTITLEEAAFGATKTISLPRLEACTACDGSGAESPDDIHTCGACQGSGVVREQRRTPFGIFATTTTCRDCNSSGKTITHKCPECRGQGRVEKTKKLKVEIPAGVEDGMRLRVAGEGEAGPQGGSSGDLYVIMNIEPHGFFERQNNDIYCEVPISFATATLGGEIDVPTLKGKAKLKIPSGTQTNTVFRMRDRGIPDVHGYGKGNQNIRVIVQVPQKVNGKQKELIKKLGKELGEEPSKGLFDKLFML